VPFGIFFSCFEGENVRYTKGMDLNLLKSVTDFKTVDIGIVCVFFYSKMA